MGQLSSHCQQQQSYSGLRSPGRSNSTFWNFFVIALFHFLLLLLLLFVVSVVVVVFVSFCCFLKKFICLCKQLTLMCLIEVVDPGKGPGRPASHPPPPPPLFLHQTEAQRAEKNFFKTTLSPFISGFGWPGSPPDPQLNGITSKSSPTQGNVGDSRYLNQKCTFTMRMAPSRPNGTDQNKLRNYPIPPYVLITPLYLPFTPFI